MFRSFAIVPAAGSSHRMGAPKLTLPLDGRMVIEHVLACWSAASVTRIVVVAKPGDAALERACRRFDVDVVMPLKDPRDMKASVHLALRHLAAKYAPAAHDVWLLAPADMPALTFAAIDGVLRAYDEQAPTAVVPVFNDRRGHPLLMPWATAGLVEHLGPHEGVNALVSRTCVREMEWRESSILADLDTPRDYAQLL